jgi:hypothetical protein
VPRHLSLAAKTLKFLHRPRDPIHARRSDMTSRM